MRLYLLEFVLGMVLGALIVRWWFYKPRWIVRVANGHTSRRMSYHAALRLKRSWPNGVAEVVRDGG